MSPFRVRKLKMAAQINFSKILHITDVSATGRKFAIMALLTLCIGMMLASFHFLGTSPSSIDFRNSWHRIGAISFEHSFKSAPKTASGPAALLGFRLRGTSSTDSSVSTTSSNFSCVRVGNSGVRDYRSSPVKTEW